jgi:hypothetical protein
MMNAVCFEVNENLSRAGLKTYLNTADGQSEADIDVMAMGPFPRKDRVREQEKDGQREQSDSKPAGRYCLLHGS